MQSFWSSKKKNFKTRKWCRENARKRFSCVFPRFSRYFEVKKIFQKNNIAFFISGVTFFFELFFYFALFFFRTIGNLRISGKVRETAGKGSLRSGYHFPERTRPKEWKLKRLEALAFWDQNLEYPSKTDPLKAFKGPHFWRFWGLCRLFGPVKTISEHLWT